MKKWLIGCGSVFALFLIFGVACVAFIGSSVDTKTNTDPIADSSNADSSKKEVAKIGDTVKAGDLEYTVLSAEARKSVQDPIGGAKEPSAGQFIVLELQVKNTGKEKITMDSNLVQVQDPNGATYQAEPMLTKGFFLEQLNPNAQKKAEVIFDVTKEPVDSFIFIGQGGFLSTAKAQVELKE